MAVSINCPCIFLLSLLYSSPSSPLSMRQRLKRWDVSTLNALYVRLCCGTASEIRLPENYWCNPNGASEHWLCSTSSSDWAFFLQNNIQSNNQFKQCWETFFSIRLNLYAFTQSLVTRITSAWTLTLYVYVRVVECRR